MIRREMRRAVVTGGAGFLGSHLCEQLLAQGTEVVCLDNFLTGSRRNVAHLAGASGFQAVDCDVTGPLNVAGPVDLVLHFASAASPVDYLKLPLETLKVGAVGTLARPGPGPGQGRAVRARLHQRGLRRPAAAPAARGLLGQREPGRPAQRLRRGQALRGGADHRLPAQPRRGHRRSSGSSTPTARGCARTTGGPSRRSSRRRWPAGR